ncbi:MAG: SulP family inorganic anion transporter [Pyramidobacter sp.]|nr:SulP family inorganic anion transporter [Pyramidobacter sp.]
MYKPKILSDAKYFTKASLTADIFAGVTVGVVALPLAMAFAIASGLPPEKGLFTAIVAGFLISAFGGSSVQIGGPTGAFVVIISGILTQYGMSGLALCTLMAGALLILFGVFRLGAFIKYIPFPVTTGFTTGIAVTIFSTQIPDLLGLNLTNVPADFIGKWSLYLSSLNGISWSAAYLSLGTILVIIAVRRFAPKAPFMLVAMVAATAAAQLLGLDAATIGSRFGDLPRSLPAPVMPQFNMGDLGGLVAPALTVAMLAAIESLLSATVADGMTGGRHDPNAELIGLGIANVGSVMFGGIPATGAIARTATNVKSGGRSPVAGMVHALVLALLLLLFAPAAKMIPLASLAGILAVVSYNMSELPNFFTICRGPKSDACVLIITFLLTVLVDLTVAVGAGVVLAALLFIHRISSLTEVKCAGKENGLDGFAAPEGVEVFEIEGPFFFGMIDTFKNALRAADSSCRAVVLVFRRALSMDASAIHALNQAYASLRRDGVQLVCACVKPQPFEAMKRAGLVDSIGADNFQPDVDSALKKAESLLSK